MALAHRFLQAVTTVTDNFGRRLTAATDAVQWTHDDLITGERLQALAEVSVLTPSVLAFHSSLRAAGVKNVCLFRGSHCELEPDPKGLEMLRGRSSIFVYTHLVSSFLERVLPRLEHRFVLITHNSDHGVDERFRPALNDPRITHWFAQNVAMRHPKLTPLPIGVANAQWPHGDLGTLLSVAATAAGPRRDLVYANFDTRTNPSVRVPLLQRLQDRSCIWSGPPRAYPEYLSEMAGFRWVISPPGNGIDCHRTWEACYLGVTPVVARTAHGALLHDGLPIAQLETLGDLSLPALSNAEGASTFGHANIARLRMSYWRDSLRRQVAASQSQAA